MANAGRILLMPKGTWTANTEYSPLDFVYFGGNSFVCKSAVSGTLDPTNDATHWQQMASGFDSDLITQTITNEPNHIASDAAVYAEVRRLESDFAQIEETTTASKAYSVGDYFTLGGTLYIVTDDIAEGGTIIPETNCEETSIGERIEAIENEKLNADHVINRLDVTEGGYALDARQGKALHDAIGRFGTMASDAGETSVSANTWATGRSITLSPGTYFMVHQAYSTNGKIRCGWSNATGCWSESSGAYSMVQFFRILHVTTTTTVSNSLYTSTAGTYQNAIVAVRIS